MNLDKCTPGQREAITTLDAPLMVAAGAGSGKTFTLTQRIVGARCANDGEKPFLDSIAQVCAITFTKKAAAELRSRVKQKLAEAGFVEDALTVDSAWITTIHGMASRMLREHALEIGLDPAFRVVSEAESKNLLERAANQVAAEVSQDNDFLMKELLDKRLMFSPMPQEGVVDRALSLLNRVNAMPARFDGLVMREPAITPSQAMRALYDAGCDFEEIASGWKKPTKTELALIESLEAAMRGAESWLDEGHAEGFLEEGFDPDAFAEVFYAFPPTSAKFHAKKPDAGFFEGYRSLYARMSNEVETGVGCREAKALVRFARLVSDRYAQLKGSSRLDNGDLLLRCVGMLRENPSLAAGYRDAFRLIMIDEFQDTDKLQVELIGLISQPKLGNVCVVGDAQQSIYRFRGADVNVFFEYRDALLNVNDRAHMVSLPDNFRSHADVLSIVDKVFAQKCCFGNDFLHLDPRAALNDQPDPMFQGSPRINLDLVHYKRPYRGQGVTKTEAVRESACHIAQHFAQLRKHGAKAAEMALLLGGMGNAGVYVQALRDAGFESVVSGGSVFAQSSEARLVAHLLRLAVNMKDEESLFLALASPLFNISDDVLAALVTARGEDGLPVRRSLSSGFACFDVDGAHGLSDADVQAFATARRAIRRFVYKARSGKADQALRQLLLDSGLLDRLEASGAVGLASAGNFSKALSLVSGFQGETSGIASTANAYALHLETSKEAPGGLSGASADVVQIMTVHASKGLEFPHIAVAELKTGSSRGGTLLVENLGDSTYLSVRGKLSEDAKKVADKLRGFDCEGFSPIPLDRAESAAELNLALQDYMAEQTRSEAQRLLYVALTRASRSLLLCYCTSSNPEDEYESDGIYGDVYQALRWDVLSSKAVSMCEYGGSMPARVSFHYLCGQENESSEDEVFEQEDVGGVCSANDGIGDGEGELFLMPLRRELPEVVSVPCSTVRNGVWSYSSLRHEPLSWDGLVEGVIGGESAAIDALSKDPSAASADDATALGSAFHTLAQRSILLRNREANVEGAARDFPVPDEQAIAAQVARWRVSPIQQVRLREALDRWFSSGVARELASYRHVNAEVPFMVTVGEGSQKLYLEGEIDALAYDDTGQALFIDYKTGGFAAEPEALLREKHRLQAQCYAYALMSEGFDSVRAVFVRVEHANHEAGDGVQTVEYEFTRSDFSSLQEVILAAAK